MRLRMHKFFHQSQTTAYKEDKKQTLIICFTNQIDIKRCGSKKLKKWFPCHGWCGSMDLLDPSPPQRPAYAFPLLFR